MPKTEMMMCSLNPITDIMTCPNMLYNTIDRIIDWDAGLPLNLFFLFNTDGKI